MFTLIRKKIILSLIIAVSVSQLSFSQNRIIDLPKGVSIYQLDNGLKVLLVEKQSLPMVGINTVVKVGSAYESFKTSGMSHMLEHLLFNGTTTMAQKELYDSTDIIGGYNNAHTGRYFTNFMMVTPAENIVDGMKLQSAMLFDSVIPEEKFEKEKGIVLEEIAKSLSNPNEQIERNMLSVIYEGHALSLPTLGTYSTIENMNRDEVYDFYKNAYVPNNMIVSVIGNFKSEEMLEHIKEIYGKEKPGLVNHKRNDQLKIGFENIDGVNLGRVYHRFYNGDKVHLQLLFNIDKPEHDEFFELIKIVLDINKQKIKNELNTSFNEQIEGIEFTNQESPVLNYIEADIILKSENDINAIQNKFIDLLRHVNFAVADETIINESIKTRTEFLKNIEKPHMFGIYNADLIAEKGIEGILASYSGKGYFSANEELMKFKLPQSFITLIQHPEIDEKSEINQDNADIELFESSKGTPTLITKQVPESDLLAIHYLFKYKNKFENKYGKDAAKVWHETFGKRMENPDVQKISSKYGFSFTVNDNPFIPMDNIYLSPEFGYIRVEGLADNIKGAIEFLNEQMLSFVPTKEEYKSASEKSMTPSMMGHGNMAKKIFDMKRNSILFKEKNNVVEPAELTYENLLEFGKEYFVPSNMIISVVSPEENSKINNCFSTFVKQGIENNPSLGISKLYKDIKDPVKIDMEGNGEQSYLYFGYLKNIEENEKPGLKVLSLILSDKIIFDIREKQGMAYRMSAGIDVKNDKAAFYINMSTRPGNVEKLITQFPSFFSKNFVGEITSSEIKKSVNMYLGRMMFRRLSSINQAYYLGHSKYFYGDINYDEEYLNELSKVTVADLQKLVDKYLKVENQIEIYVR